MIISNLPTENLTPEDRSYISELARELEKSYIYYKGYKFKLNYLINCLLPCDDYDYTDLRDTDRVLDLGAAIGGFSIPISPNVKEIVAIEPLYPELLVDNIVLNKVTNIAVVSIAIAGEDRLGIALNYDPRTSVCNAVTLNSLLNQLGEFDFLKSDIEMAEWFFTADDLKRFRRIEIEVHNFDKNHPIEKYEARVKEAGFEYYISTSYNQHYIHGFKKE